MIFPLLLGESTYELLVSLRELPRLLLWKAPLWE